MTVLSKWSVSAMTARAKGHGSGAPNLNGDVSASMSNLSLSTEDPYTSRNKSDGSLSSSQISATDSGIPLGTLIIVVMKAKNLYNRRAISKQNPYCSVRVAKHNDRTKAIMRGGQAPVWDHETRFRSNADDDNRVLKLCVFDQNGSTTDIIGDAIIQSKPALESSPDVGYDDWFPIHFNKKYVGEVYLEMTFYAAKQPSRRSSTTSSMSSKRNSSQTTSLTGNSLANGSVSPTRSGSRSTSPVRSSMPATASGVVQPRPCSPIRSSSPQRSLNSARSSLGMKHSESMPILKEHTLPKPVSHDANHTYDDLADTTGRHENFNEAPYTGSIIVPTHSPYGSPYHRTSSPALYANSGASHSAASLQRKPSPRRSARPLPHVPAEAPEIKHSALHSTLPSSPSAPHFSYDALRSDRAQEDISKQINDGYEASLFERSKP